MELALGILLWLAFLAVVLAVYFLPTVIAYARVKRNIWAIFALNLLLGWSVIGWVIALVWALSVETVDP